MLKHLVCLTIILTIFFHSLNAQNRWQPGYIIDSHGDTTHGYIDDKGKNANAKLCVFKESADGEVLRYSPEQLAGYRFKDGRYFVPKNVGEGQAAENVFLEFLIKGEANIYHYVGDRFFIEKDGAMHELKNTERTVRENGYEYQVYGKEYIGILNYLLKDANMQKDIQSTSLDPKSLIKTAKKYHETVCPDEDCIIFKREIQPSRVRVGLLAGATFNKLNFGGKLTSDYALGVAIGARIVIENLSDWTDRFSIFLDPTVYLLSDYTLKSIEGQSARLKYAGEEYDITTEDHHSFIVQPALDVKLRIAAFNIPLCLNYSFHGDRGRPYLGAGIVNMFILSQNDEFTYHWFQDEYGKSIPVYHLGFTALLGYNMSLNNGKALILESNYQYTSNLNINQSLRMINHFFSLRIGYLF